MAYFQVDGLYKNFGGTEVLKGVDFTAEKGEVVVILGPSGGGKTTFLRCINMLEQPDRGVMALDGETIWRANGDRKHCAASGRPRLGLVFQAFNLFPHFNVLDNLTLPARLKYKATIEKSLYMFSRSARARKKSEYEKINERAYALLERVGLGDKAKSYPCELSGGQMQRVAIARALMLDPEILCFDEPTSALDPELTREVLNVIIDLKREGRTLIVVTHEIEFARNVADKIVFMAGGVVIYRGETEEAFNSENEKVKNFLAEYRRGGV